MFLSAMLHVETDFKNVSVQNTKWQTFTGQIKDKSSKLNRIRVI